MITITKKGKVRLDKPYVPSKLFWGKCSFCKGEYKCIEIDLSTVCDYSLYKVGYLSCPNPTCKETISMSSKWD